MRSRPVQSQTTNLHDRTARDERFRRRADTLAFLETRHKLGGEGSVRLSSDPVLDQELSINLYARSKRTASPHVGLDAVVDVIAHTGYDISSLIAEIRRLRSAQL